MKEYLCKYCGKVFCSRRSKTFCSLKCVNLWQKGKHFSLNTEFKKGQIPWDKRRTFTKEHKEKLRIAKLEKPTKYWLGKKRYPETIEKLRKANTGKKLSFKTKVKIGEASKVAWLKWKENPQIMQKIRERSSFLHKGSKCTFWNGGISKLSKSIRGCYQYKLWRRNIFERDNFTCRICGIKSGNGRRVILHPHHFPKTFSLILKENKIDTIKKAISCEDLWNVKNGITLCINCHQQTKTYLSQKGQKP